MSESPDIYMDRMARMSAEELAEVRSMVTSAAWVKFLRIIACLKPSSNCTKTGSGDRDEFSDARANARLGEIRGWELYEFAIFRALNETPQEKTEVVESFPDSGRVDAGWDRPIESEKKTRRRK